MSKNKIVAGNKDLGNDGTKGGIFKGKRHHDGGIEVEVQGGGKVEVETDEPIIVPKAVNADTTVTFDGKKMKPKEVISKINTDYGGVPIKKKGGVIDAKAEIKRLRDIKEKGGVLKVGDKTNVGIIEEVYPTQYKINGQYFHKSLIQPVSKNVDEKQYIYDSVKSKLEKENGNGFITLYHGTDEKNYDKIISSKKIGIGKGVTFFTSNKKEAKEYAENKSNYRGVKSGKVLEVKMPKWAVTKNKATGEYETEFVLEEINDIFYPTKESVYAEYKEQYLERGGKIEQPIKVAAGSVVITRDAALDEKTKHEYNGEMLTNKEILSRINHDIGGGVEFAEGGKIGKSKLKVNESFGDWAITRYEPVTYNDDSTLSGGIIKLVNQDTFDDVVIRNDRALRNNVWFISYKNIKIEDKSPIKVIEKFLKVYESEFESGGSLDCGCNHTMAKGGLIAPNGKQSNLTPEQYKLVRTPQFKAWFGDWENDPTNASKVIDDNGEPLVVYHGTLQKFNVFKTYFDNGTYHGKGAYFTSSLKDLRTNYVTNKDDIYLECFLNLTNPLIVGKKSESTYFERKDREIILQQLRYYKFPRVNYAYEKSYDSDILEKIVREEFRESKSGELLNSIYRELGFSGIIFLSPNKLKGHTAPLKTNHFVAFKPNQIKLADVTNTTFDATNNDIRFEKGGNVSVHEETYKKWKSLVNMTKSELENFYNSEEGKEAGLSESEADKLGIHNGRESARWIFKMKDTPKEDWTPTMWDWANRQISFISRMSGNKGGLYDDKGNKTRKHTSLLIWGHNPEKFEGGGEFGINKNPDKINYRIVTEDYRIKYAGTGHDSWFTLDKARKLVDYSKGEMIYEYNHNGDMIWEVFEKGGEINKEDVMLCENCGWTWKVADSTPIDKYICYGCGHNNYKKSN